jgi:curli biogenesis system outer membrane secretion channel CsgG/ribosomal protein L40E
MSGQESNMFRVATRILLAMAMLGLCGCGDWTGSHPASTYVPPPGQYSPPTDSASRLRVAVPELAVEKPVGLAADVDPQAAASDELFSLLDSSNRCDLTERVRLRQALAEQKLSDMLEPGRLVHPAPVKGFDYLLLGRITELSIRRGLPPNGLSVAGVENSLHIGQAWTPKLFASAKASLSLVDARTGAVAVMGSSEFYRAALPHELGLQLTSEQLASSQDVRLNAADTHRILRLALDEALRPLLPRIDRYAAAQPGAKDIPKLAGGTATAPSSRPTSDAPHILLSTQICPECGARVGADQEFCPNCGHKLR